MIKRLIVGLVIFLIISSSSSSFPLLAKESDYSFTANDNQFFFISIPAQNIIKVFDSYGIYIKDYPLTEKLTSIQSITSCPCGGYLLIADTLKKQIISIDEKNGTVLHRIKGVDIIGDVTISREKTRYEGIVSITQNSIHLYKETGEQIRIIKGNTIFKEASRIHLNFQNHIYVADNQSKKLIELDVKGNLIRTISDQNYSHGKVLDISSDQKGNLYILDEKAGLIKFSSSGKFIKKIPYPIELKPVEIGIDDNNSIIYLFADSVITKLNFDFIPIDSLKNSLQSQKKSIIQLKIGSRILTLVGFDVKIMDTAPFIEPNSNRTFVPIRFISENLQSRVTWDQKLSQVTINKSGINIQLWIGKKTVKINGLSYSLDASPMLKDNRTFVPLRFISEALLAEVYWYADKRLIRILSLAE